MTPTRLAEEVTMTDELKNAAITACALMIQGICMTRPQSEWVESIENRIHYLLTHRLPQAGALLSASKAAAPDVVKWPHEITRGHIECLIADHQRDGQKQLAARLNSSGSYLIRVAESFRWCLEQMDAAAPAAPAQSERPVVFRGPEKLTTEEMANGNCGIRWIAADGVYGCPTNHDVMEYLKRTPLMNGCTCEGCKAFYAAPQAGASSGGGLTNDQLRALKLAAAMDDDDDKRTREEIEAAFNAFADQYDHNSNEWLDMDVQKYFEAGYKARFPSRLIAQSGYFDEEDAFQEWVKTQKGKEAMSILEIALNRMDHARNILIGGNPRPDCNWGALDTSGLRELLAAAKEKS